MSQLNDPKMRFVGVNRLNTIAKKISIWWWVSIFSFLGASVIMMNLPVLGPPACIDSAEASATYSYGEFSASNLIDFKTEETTYSANQWLLPGDTLGDVQLKLSYPYEISAIRILNTCNREYKDRATKRVLVRLFNDDQLLWQKETNVEPYPEWTGIPVDCDQPVNNLNIEVLDYEGLGGGLNEVRLVARNPAGWAGDFFWKTLFVLFIWIPLVLYWNSLGEVPSWIKALSYIGLVFVLYIVMWQFLARPSFPIGHEYDSQRDRIAIYLWHFLRGDFLPVWSSSSALGFGSPFPVYYHRVFYYITASAYLVTGSIKLSVLYGIAIFSTAAIAGMISILRKIGIGVFSAVLLGICLPLLNYSYFSFTVRQALCEYAAMCLVPWVLLWCYNCLGSTKASKLFLSGVILFPLIYFTHSLTFFLSAFPVILSTLWRFYQDKENRTRLFIGYLGIGLVFLLTTIPWVILQVRLAENLNFGEVISLYKPLEQFVPILRYFIDPQAHWGLDLRNTVLLDMGFIFTVFASLLYILKNFGRTGWRKFCECGGLFFGILCIWYLFLQSKASAPIYEHIPGFSYVQFPWRALTFVTVLEVVLAGVVLRTISTLTRSSAPLPAFGSFLLLVITLVGTPYRLWITREWFDSHQFENIGPAETGTWPFMHAEYWPKMKLEQPGRPIDFLSKQNPKAAMRDWTTENYEIKRVDLHFFEDDQYDYRLRVRKNCVIVLPANYSGYEKVQLKGKNGLWVPVKTFRTEENFLIQIKCEPGEYDLKLEFPSLGSMWGQRIRM